MPDKEKRQPTTKATKENAELVWQAYSLRDVVREKGGEREREKQRRKLSPHKVQKKFLYVY